MNEHHGYSNQSRIYRIWRRMRERCKSKNEKNYAARGISVCPEWDDSFVPFLQWALKNGYSDSLSIDRVDNNRGYSPDNCRWATPKQQTLNRRPEAVGLAVEHGGSTRSLLEWSRISGIYYTTLVKRYHKGLRGTALFSAVHRPM